VAAHSGPYPIVGDTGPVGPIMRSAGIVTTVGVEGRPPGVATVDQPKVTDGTWIRSGGVVVERSFAEAADLRLGQTITLNGRPFQVVGFAVTAAIGGFPGISLMWATEATVRSLATKADPVSYISNLKLSDASPRAVAVFVNAHNTNNASSPFLTSWTVIAYGDASFLRSDQVVLLTGATLLGLLALASVAVLVGSRLAEGTRRVGLLKASVARRTWSRRPSWPRTCSWRSLRLSLACWPAGVRPRSSPIPRPISSVLRERRRSRSSRSQ
jgi:hypothetical protein